MSAWSKQYLQICRERVCTERAIADLELYIGACKRSGESTGELEMHLSNLRAQLQGLDADMHNMLGAARWSE
ncbi:hypothetical protein VPHK438_0014 [Vibrio phage K438]